MTDEQLYKFYKVLRSIETSLAVIAICQLVSCVK